MEQSESLSQYLRQRSERDGRIIKAECSVDIAHEDIPSNPTIDYKDHDQYIHATV